MYPFAFIVGSALLLFWLRWRKPSRYRCRCGSTFATRQTLNQHRHTAHFD